MLLQCARDQQRGWKESESQAQRPKTIPHFSKTHMLLDLQQGYILTNSSWVENTFNIQQRTYCLLSWSHGWLVTAHFHCPASRESILLHIISPGKDQNSNLEVWFLLNVYCFYNITSQRPFVNPFCMLCGSGAGSFKRFSFTTGQNVKLCW